MEPELEKEVQQRFESLPPDVKAAIHSADFTKKLQAIGNAHLLHIDQLTALEEEIMLVMLGFSKPDDFSAHVAESVRVPRDAAEGITKEVSEQIFQPIRASLQVVHTRAAQTEPAPEAPIPPNPVNPSPEPAPMPPQPSPVPTPTPVPQPTPVPTPSPAPEVPPTTPVPTPPPVPAAAAPAFPAADATLTKQTVVAPAKSYNVDPYREPIE